MFTPTLEPRKTVATPSAFEELRVSPLRNTVLLDYLAKRGIPSGIAVRECVEVHYRTRGKWYFGIGFRNRKGGMEIRNPYFKGSTSPKDITHLRHAPKGNERTAVLVFEGFMDYLSYLALKQGQPVPDCVVLNSVGNLPGALDVLKGYGHVCCFLDNDDAGRRTTEEIRRRCGSVTDKAVHYLPHKDLNEFLQHRLKKTVETCAEPKQESG
ncbi:toprim domain-containing protein [Bacteroides fragilis]|uniref:toprim domain-containing protein n=1 Tax=Bacteroides fragilis TaxID=817 RepID=UPI0032EE50A2